MSRDPREIAQRITDLMLADDLVAISVNEEKMTEFLTRALAAEMPRWVPRNERVPRPNQLVLAYYLPLERKRNDTH